MPEKTPPLRACVRRSLDTYFKELEDTETQNLHAMVVAEVEKPLLEVVMKRTGGNQLRAARILGLNRNTLRKKLDRYGLK
jgi:Fis family transcriptional regulator